MPDVSVFWNSYAHQNTLFALFHAIVGLIAIVTLIRHFVLLSQLRARIASRPHITELEAQQEFEEAQHLVPVYDACSNFFVLIGLLGTIVGFFKALQQTHGVDVKSISPAMATSGFGIFWALLLGLFVWLTVEPAINSIQASHRSRVSDTLLKYGLEQLAQKYDNAIQQVKDLVSSTTLQLSQSFTGSTQAFISATDKLAKAATDLADSAQYSQAAFKKTIDKANETVAQVDSIFALTTVLPEKVVTALTVFSEQQAKKLDSFSTSLVRQFEELAHTFAEHLKEVSGVPAVLRDELEQAHQAYLVEFGNVAQRASQETSQSLQLWQSSFQTMLDLEKQHFEQMVAETARLYEETRGISASLKQEIRGARNEFEEAHLLYLTRLTELFQSSSQDVSRRFELWQGSLQTMLDLQKQHFDQMTAETTRLYTEARGVPVSLEEQMKRWTETYRSVLQQQQEADLALIRSQVAQVSLDAAREVQKTALQLESKTREFVKDREEIYQQETQIIRDTLSSLLNSVQRDLHSIKSEITGSLAQLPEDVRTETTHIQVQVKDMVQEMQSCGASLVSGAEASTSQLNALVTATQILNAALVRLTSSLEKSENIEPVLREIRDGIKAQQTTITGLIGALHENRNDTAEKVNVPTRRNGRSYFSWPWKR